MPHAPNILLLSAEQDEIAIIKNLLRGKAVLRCFETMAEAKRFLITGQNDLLFCNWTFRDGQWKDVLAVAKYFQPDLPIVVLSRNGNEREWVKVIDRGAFDLLVPPYGGTRLLAVMEQALASYQARIRQKDRVRPRLLRAS
jgi:DNA-binding NtrC family response regulator